MTTPRTMFEKIWSQHVVRQGSGDWALLFIDRHLLLHMGLVPGTPIAEVRVDRVFIGSCTGGVDRTTRILGTHVFAMSAEAARHLTIGMKCTEAIVTLAAQGFVVASTLDCPAEVFMEAPSGRFCYAILFTAQSAP